jgi:putative oxidoreductase
MRFLARLEPLACHLLRFVSGAMFSLHGVKRCSGLTDRERCALHAGLGGGVIELACGVLVALGLFTRRPPSSPRERWPSPTSSSTTSGGSTPGTVPVVNKGETVVLYCFVFLFIATRGGGRFGLDRALRRD